MSFSNGPKGIVTDGLVFSADAGNTQCWNPNASTSGSFNNLANPTTGSIHNDTSGSLGSNGSWIFDGTDDYCVTAMDGTSGGGFGSGAAKEFTVSFWFTTNTISSGQQGLFQWANVVNDPTALVIIVTDDDEIKFWARTYTTLTGTISTDTWYNITLSRTASDNIWRSYLNGIANSTYGDVGVIPSEAAAIELYFMSGYNAYGDGKFTHFLLYDRALSSSEVTQNYNSQKSRFGL